MTTLTADPHNGGKTYQFDDTHDPRLPAQWWFQESQEGLILFLIFYSRACRWGRCLGCNLPSRMASHTIPFEPLMAQVDCLFAQQPIQARSTAIRKVIAGNNGSLLDEQTFSSTALMYFLAKLNVHLPHLDVLCIETRPEYVDLAELEFIARALKEGKTQTRLELAIGFEAFDDHIRNDIYLKGLTLNAFERLARDAAPYGHRLKCYFMLKPIPGITTQQAIDDIHHAIDYLAQCATQYHIPINMHLNPTYVAAGTLLEQAFLRGEYHPPSLRDAAEAARAANRSGISLFLGLSDEGLAVPGGSFRRPGDDPIVEALEKFNCTQDYALLDAVAEGMIR